MSVEWNVLALAWQARSYEYDHAHNLLFVSAARVLLSGLAGPFSLRPIFQELLLPSRPCCVPLTPAASAVPLTCDQPLAKKANSWPLTFV